MIESPFLHSCLSQHFVSAYIASLDSTLTVLYYKQYTALSRNLHLLTT